MGGKKLHFLELKQKLDGQTKALATVYGPGLYLTCGNEFSRRKKFLDTDPNYLHF